MFFSRDFFDPLDQIEIPLEIFSLKTGDLAAEVIFRQVFETFDLAGQKSTPKRTIRDKADT